MVVYHAYRLHESVADRAADELEASLLQDREPTQTGLRPFKHEKLEQQPVIVDWQTPFLIVIVDATTSRGCGPKCGRSFSLSGRTRTTRKTRPRGHQPPDPLAL